MPDHQHPSPKVPESRDWRELAQEAIQEMNGQKLVEIVRRICDTLDQVEERKKPRRAETVSEVSRCNMAD